MSCSGNNDLGYITHDEAMIRNFMDEPDYADYYLHNVIHDGDAEEIAQAQAWYNEAKARTQNLGYWATIIDNAEQGAKDGQNIDIIIALMTRALGILKNSVHINA